MNYELRKLFDTVVSICDVISVNVEPQRLLCALVSICDEIHNSSFLIHNWRYAHHQDRV